MSQRESNQPSVSRNYIMNLLVSLLNFFTPLLATPYIARTLGAENIGIYSYCLSIETYFVVLGALGIPIYAKREIASARGQQENLNQLFSEALTMQASLLLLCAIAYVFITAAFFDASYRLMFLICGLGILAAMLDVSWLYLGFEDFPSIVLRGFVFKILFLALIFLLVKKESDLYLYALAIMLPNCFCNAWLFFGSRKYVKYTPPSFQRVIRHIKPSFFLLLPGMVTTIYAVIDKTMLGTLSGNMSEVGFYEQSQKIVGVVMALATSLGAVLMPRLSLLYSEGKEDEFHRYIDKGCSIICFISMPLAVGCFYLSSNLVPWFFGSGFEKVVGLLKVFSPMFVFMGLNDLIGVQSLVATRKERRLLVINVVTTFINLSLNALLIPRHLAAGAASATVISEAVKFALFVIGGRDYVSISVFVKSALKYGAAAVAMGFGLRTLQATWLNVPSFTHTVLLTLCGGFLYAAILTLVRDQWMLKSLRVVFGIGRRAGGRLFRK